MLRSTFAFFALASLAIAQTPPAAAPSPSAPRPKVTYSSIHTDSPTIAITFDDGPHKVETPRLLDMLAKRNIKATFYVVGQCVRDNPEITKRIIAEGHELGNHSWNHANLQKLGESGVRTQLQDTHDAVRSAAGVEMKTFRPPYGAFSQAQEIWVNKELGYKTIRWDVDPFDWKKPGSGVIAQRILNLTKPGSIVLAHDIHKQTVDSMPETLDGLLAKGYKFVTVSELLTMDRPKPPAPPAPPKPVAPVASSEATKPTPAAKAK